MSDLFRFIYCNQLFLLSLSFTSLMNGLPGICALLLEPFSLLLSLLLPLLLPLLLLLLLLCSQSVSQSVNRHLNRLLCFVESRRFASNWHTKAHTHTHTHTQTNIHKERERERERERDRNLPVQQSHSLSLLILLAHHRWPIYSILFNNIFILLDYCLIQSYYLSDNKAAHTTFNAPPT